MDIYNARYAALSLAQAYNEPPEKIIERAQAYLDFLSSASGIAARSDETAKTGSARRAKARSRKAGDAR